MSDIEYEGKILDIDVQAISESICAADGTQNGDWTFRRYVFDTVPAKPGKWARLRTNGITTTLAVKEIQDDSIEGTSEWEIEVSDFDKTLTILTKCSMSITSYQENRRINFALHDSQLSIDFWPRLKPYLEIEASSKEEVEKIAKKLGFDPGQLIGDNTAKLYERVGIDLHAIENLKFE
jgi:adenylate cyclase class 2